MKKLVRILIVIGIIINSTNLNAQANPDSNYPGTSIGGFFDKIFDQNGKSYPLATMQLPNAQGQTPNNPTAKQSSVFVCNSGYYTLWFEQDWDGIAPNKLNATQAAQAQATICQVFRDLSNFIQRPAGAADNVQIWIRDITQMGVTAPTSSGTRGVASPFYYMPPMSSGIADNLVWLTINGGKDGWTNVASPLGFTNVATQNAAGYFHGQFGLNFSNINLPWELVSSNAVTANRVDLYSVVLHEMLHFMGFASHINSTSQSVFGATFPYYSRFDLNLKTNLGASLITTPTVNCNPIYNNIYNTTVPTTSFNSTGGTSSTSSNNSISCNAIKYISSNIVSPGIPIYTPSTYEPGSSMSHLEDECPLTGGSCGTACEDQFYVMSNAIPANIAKRAPREHERIILNNIGYNVNTNNTYITNMGLSGASTTTYTTTTTTTPAINLGIRTVGYCDGIASGAYNLTVNAGSTLSISVANIIANDVNATGITCPEVLNSAGSSVTVSGGNLLFTASSTAAGIVLIRYIPTAIINGITFFGNITYIYILINGNCPPSPCNFVSNGGFENYTGNNHCGEFFGGIQMANCWLAYSGSPDIFSNSNNCTTGWSFALGTVNNVWNPGGVNTRALGLYSIVNTLGVIMNESSQTFLSTPIVNGGWYTLKFKCAGIIGTTFPNLNLSIAGSNSTLAGNNNFSLSNVGVLPIHASLSTIQIPFTNQWHSYSITFQYNGTQNINNLILSTDNSPFYLTPPPIGTSSSFGAIIDDIELVSGSGGIAFTPPANASCNGIVTNLAQYLNAIPSSGLSFSGPNNSVYQNGTQWDFNPAHAGNGNAIITCTYTDLNGCIVNVSANIAVANSFSFTVASNPCILTGGTATLTATGMPVGSTINWVNSSNVSIGTTNTVTVTAAGNYSATVTSGGCSSTIGISNQASQCVNTLAGNLPNSMPTSTYSNNPNGYVINSNTTITGNVLFRNTDISIKNGAAMIIASGATLTIEAAHLHGCTDMWQGITVSPGGKLITKGNTLGSTLIEDATNAITINNHTSTSNILDVTNTIFNKNETSISIANYVENAALYPFRIENNVFTCRTLPLPTCGLWPNWPTVAALQTITTNTINTLPSPYSTLTNMPVATLLNIGAETSNTHIKAINVGFTGGTISLPTYTGMLNINTIGTTTIVPGINLIDYAKSGIYAQNANLKVVNSVIQNCENGIIALGTIGFKKSLIQQPYSNVQICNTVSGNNQIAGNKFYDNQLSSILIGSYSNVDIVGNEFRSIQSKANMVNNVFPSINNNTLGKVAISISNSNTLIHNIKYNNIYNNKVGIFYQQNIAKKILSLTTLSKFPGDVQITNNTIQPTNGASGAIQPFVSEAIVTTMIGGPLTTTYTNVALNARLNIATNTISNVYRGIEVGSYNWPKHSVIINGNTITQDVDPNTSATSMQHGIWCRNNKGSLYIRGNSVTFNSTIPTSVPNMANLFNTNANVSGRQTNYRMDQNERQVITCNQSLKGIIGFEFNGVSPTTQFRNGNNMNGSHFLGMLLNNGAIIGVQPAGIDATTCVSNAPNINTGNIWNFTANTTINQPKHTWVQNAATIPVTNCNPVNTNNGAGLSALQVLGSGLTRPTGNLGSGTVNSNWYITANNSLRTVTTASSGCAPALPAFIASPISIGNIQVLNAVANGLTFEAMSTQLNYIDKYYLYVLQKSNADYISASTDLQTFYNTANASTNNYRKMYDIDEALSQGNPALAQTLNTALIPTNVAEINTKNYNNLAIKVQNGIALTSAEINELAVIANECPHTDGICVYSARDLYNTISMASSADYISFPDNCDPAGLYKAADIKPTSLTFDAILSPNPTSDGFNINIMNAKIDNMSVQIFDIAGQQVFTEKFSSRNNSIYVNPILPSGSYLVKITNQHNETITKKLIVQ
jgi:Secretion system C-terminal sorting domain